MSGWTSQIIECLLVGSSSCFPEWSQILFYFRAIHPFFPTDLACQIQSLLTAATSNDSVEHPLDRLIRFLIGTEDTVILSPDGHSEWSERQKAASTILRGMVNSNLPLNAAATGLTRNDVLDAGNHMQRHQNSSGIQGSSKQEFENAMYTLQSASAASPMRRNSILPSTNAISNFYILPSTLLMLSLPF